MLIVTTITNIANIFASGYTVMNISNQAIGGANGNWNTPDVYIPTSEVGRHHYIDNISVTRELDDKLRERDSGTDGTWQVLANNKMTQLTFNSSPYVLYMVAGNFDLYIDSRWYYVGNTTINSAHWFLDYLG